MGQLQDGEPLFELQDGHISLTSGNSYGSVQEGCYRHHGRAEIAPKPWFLLMLLERSSLTAKIERGLYSPLTILSPYGPGEQREAGHPNPS